MTSKIIFSSNKIQVVTNSQTQQMLDRFHLGKLLSFKKTEKGAMNQTFFITSTKGEFVLKGNPLYRGQFSEEKYFVDNLAKHTNIPVPYPYLVDELEDIFGFSYAIMPRLPGIHMNSGEIETREEKLRIAELASEVLKEFHSWKICSFGDLDPVNTVITPFKEPYTDWLYNRIRYWLEDAKKYSEITTKDIAFVENQLEVSKKAFNSFSSPTFVMGDFKSDNFLVKSDGDKWELSGVFDFTNSYFGDPVTDLVKMIIMYIDNREEEFAGHFLSCYLRGLQSKEAFLQRIKVHIIQQRILDWGCAKAIGMVNWDNNITFSKWVEYYIESVSKLIKE